MRVIPTGAIFHGFCQVQSEYCNARDGGVVTAVQSVETYQQVNVCKTCLDNQIRTRQWNIEGASVPGMKYQLDIAAISNDSGNVLIAIEVKNWLHANIEWAQKIVSQINRRKPLPNCNYFMLATPSFLYVWNMNDGYILDDSVIELKVDSYLERIANRLDLSINDYIVNDGGEFKNSPHTSAKKHMLLERIMKSALVSETFINILPIEVVNILKDSRVEVEYILE
ncbi:TPA: hypothetical protein ACPVZ0_004704 [Vibrio parahaemolyticus]